MATNTIDAGLLAKMFLAGAKNLEVKKEWINELNVFPVPVHAVKSLCARMIPAVYWLSIFILMW